MRSLVAVLLVACSSGGAPEPVAPDGGPPSDGAAAAEGGISVSEFTCSGHASLSTIQPPGVPPQAYAITSFLSTVITNVDGTLSAYSGTDAAANCVFHYTPPVAGVAMLVTPLMCPGPLAGTIASYTSGTSSLMGTTSTVTLDADLTGMADGSVTKATIVEVLTCLKK